MLPIATHNSGLAPVHIHWAEQRYQAAHDCLQTLRYADPTSTGTTEELVSGIALTKEILRRQLKHSASLYGTSGDTIMLCAPGQGKEDAVGDELHRHVGSWLALRTLAKNPAVFRTLIAKYKTVIEHLQHQTATTDELLPLYEVKKAFDPSREAMEYLAAENRDFRDLPSIQISHTSPVGETSASRSSRRSSLPSILQQARQAPEPRQSERARQVEQPLAQHLSDSVPSSSNRQATPVRASELPAQEYDMHALTAQLRTCVMQPAVVAQYSEYVQTGRFLDQASIALPHINSLQRREIILQTLADIAPELNVNRELSAIRHHYGRTIRTGQRGAAIESLLHSLEKLTPDIPE